MIEDAPVLTQGEEHGQEVAHVITTAAGTVTLALKVAAETTGIVLVLV